jgi:hypothetical protein
VSRIYFIGLGILISGALILVAEIISIGSAPLETLVTKIGIGMMLIGAFIAIIGRTINED